jgi:large subunit ribosomal protein L15
MNLQDVRRIHVPRTQRKRVGRGWGSGIGKTSTRGEKGAGRRSGTKFRLRFEGGQMPLYRRLPKKGFTNAAFRVSYHVVNVGDLDRAFEAGATVDLETVRAAHLAPKNAQRLKILGDGTLTKALTVKADAASEGARKKIEDAKGTLTLPAEAVAANEAAKAAAAKKVERDAAARATAEKTIADARKAAREAPKGAAKGAKPAKAPKEGKAPPAAAAEGGAPKKAEGKAEGKKPKGEKPGAGGAKPSGGGPA